ncbi:MAG: tRNA (adenosine(37)-N6)-threonylcarbamoyltransferase complex dimerization subunit type 1 TsaB [Muribaculaceae bacterium]|nr:tRNA (adenosine(37)-N6)-threonylcarbamoyltransferase complex dimerization subunit type 1 TsaB [Muribaculaceae bacterium]
MPNILNIETSSSQCSVCISKGAEIIVGFESSKNMDHSTSLAPFVEKCISELKSNDESLDAVSVSNGPGSYTGLRIGLSLAKGIAFGLSIPLITISSLEILAVRAMFSFPEISGEELIVPMIDARRMEVYTSVFDCRLDIIEPPRAEILTSNSFNELDKARQVIFIGDGSEKFKDLYEGDNAIWMGNGMPHAKYMAPLSLKYYKEKKFADVAYAVPFYLKDYITTTPKSLLHNLC